MQNSTFIFLKLIIEIVFEVVIRKEKSSCHKIRILHIVHGLSMGGAEMALVHYIKALGSENYDHYVYCFGYDGPTRNKIESLGVPVMMRAKRASIKKPIKFVFSLLSLIRNLMVFIKSRQIQIIQSHSGEANQLGVLIGKLAGLPAFPTVHSTMAFRDSRGNRDPRVYLIKIINAFIYRSACKILAVSHEVKEIVVQTYGLKDSDVQVLKNGIVFVNSLAKPTDIENEFAVAKNKMKIFAAGRLVGLKRYDVLIKAVYEIVNRGFYNILVLIAGEGEERSKLEELIRRLKLERYIKLLGLRHDVIELMKTSNIFVLPSSYEGLSIAMIEAMACGLPVIASNVPGLKEFILNGENGLLFPLGDYFALADHIIKLTTEEDLRTKLSYGARDSFNKDYDMLENIKSLDKLFKESITAN